MAGMPIILAIPYAVAAVVYFRRYPAWALWLALWCPVVATWSPQNPTWGAHVYSPLLCLSTVVLAMAALEAYFNHAGAFPVTVSLSTYLGVLSVGAGWACLHYYQPEATSLAAGIRQAALCLRVGITCFLLLAVAFWASTGRLRVKTAEFRHLFVVLLVGLSFSVGSLLMSRVGWFHWWDWDTALQLTRSALVTISTCVLLCSRRGATVTPIDARSDRLFAQFSQASQTDGLLPRS